MSREQNNPLTEQQVRAGLSEARRMVTHSIGYRFADGIAPFAEEYKRLAHRALDYVEALISHPAPAEETPGLMSHIAIREDHRAEIANQHVTITTTGPAADEDGGVPEGLLLDEIRERRSQLRKLQHALNDAQVENARLVEALEQKEKELIKWKESKFSLEGIHTDSRGNPQ